MSSQEPNGDVANHHTITIGGVPIAFPYKRPYPSQKQLMAKMIACLSKQQNALLESPTGSGKSLAILCSVLAWHKHNYPTNKPAHTNTATAEGPTPLLPVKPVSDADYGDKLNEFKFDGTAAQSAHATTTMAAKRPPKMIFTSRTHGQLQQLIAEYRRTPYFHHFQMVVLASRKSLCINSVIQPLSDRNEQCKKALENRDCAYHKSRAYSERFKQLSAFAKGTAFDIEDLVMEGEKRALCPYFGSRALLENADVIFCPYNYILDPVIRQQMAIDLKSNILVIDEAHNVENVCRDALTQKFDHDDLASAIDELSKFCGGGGGARKGKKLPENVENAMAEMKFLLESVHAWMQDLISTLNSADYTQHKNVFPRKNGGGEKLSEIFREHFGYASQQKAQHLAHAQEIFTYFQELKQEQSNPLPPVAEQNGNAKVDKYFSKMSLSPKSSKLIEYLAMIMLPTVLENENEFHMAVFPDPKWDDHLRAKRAGFWLHFWCFSPAVAFKAIRDDTRSVILTSGTLSPLEGIQYELQCTFHHQLIADHVIANGQVLVAAIDRGVHGQQLKMTYANYSNEAMLNDYGESLLTLFENIPGGIVVFFPSYKTMEMCVTQWTTSGVYERMTRVKRMYEEPSGGNETATKQFMDAIDKFGRDCGNVRYMEKHQRSRQHGVQKEKKLQKEKQEAEEKKQKAEDKKKKNSILSYMQQSQPRDENMKDYSFTAASESSGDEDSDVEMMPSGNRSGTGNKKGAVFLGVCRGKISEGIDFSDNMSRAVILIGIPFPNQKDTQVFYKKMYNDRQSTKKKIENSTKLGNGAAGGVKETYVLNGKAWYDQQAYRALNQALGRCIRHRYDYGCILFLESRFCSSQLPGAHAPHKLNKNIQSLSKWVRPQIRNCVSVPMAVTHFIKPYFEFMAKSPPKPHLEGQPRWQSPFPAPVSHNNNMYSQMSQMSQQQTRQPMRHAFTQRAPVSNSLQSNEHSRKPLSTSLRTSASSNGNNNGNGNNGNDNHRNGDFSRKRKLDMIDREPVATSSGTNGHQNHQDESSKRMKTDRQQSPILSNESAPQTKTAVTDAAIPASTNSNKSSAAAAPPNCIKCKCGATVCYGEFSHVHLPKANGEQMLFAATPQKWPCDTASNCIWSSKLGLCFMYKLCDACNKSLGFHIVGAATPEQCQFVGQILFISSVTTLLRA